VTAVYHSSDPTSFPPKLVGGSAFKISPNIVVTALHVVQSEKKGKAGRPDSEVVYKR